jgi:putative membrane protein
MSLKDKKIIVLSVDKDNDVGKSTGIPTPIVGREKVSLSATKFAISSPEDSDVNSLFASINTYDSLVAQGFNCEVAAIAGSEQGGFEADLKIVAELESVLGTFRADGAIFVSDGASDEQVIPAIQTKVPVISVRKVFVQQQESVEETYVLFYRYFKKLAEPQFSKVALGVPGVAILAIITLWFLNLISYALISLGILLGVVLLLKGFHVGSFLRSEWAESPIKLITTVIGIIISAVAVYRGIAIALAEVSPSDQSTLFVSIFLYNTIDLMAIGIAVYICGRIVVKYLDDSPKLWHEIVGLVALVFIRQMVVDASPIIADPLSSLTPFLLTAGFGAALCALLVIIFTVSTRIRRKPLTEQP